MAINKHVVIHLAIYIIKQFLDLKPVLSESKPIGNYQMYQLNMLSCIKAIL